MDRSTEAQVDNANKKMTTEAEEAELVPTGPPWYSKLFECVRNRNRIGPGRVELPECDFFIVGPRRTLRVLIPTPKGSGHYEPAANERPETIDENFVSRWATRPHPSGNCRCSFRQSNRLSTDEERLISAEINRIRTSLCEAEETGEDIEELEQRISLNLDGLSVTDVQPARSRVEVDEKLAEIGNVGSPIVKSSEDDAAIKRKIVKDLEKYIEVLLQEVLNDTMKFFSDAGDTLKRSREALRSEKSLSCGSVCANPEHLLSCRSENEETAKIREITEDKLFVEEPSSLNISFAFHEQQEGTRDKRVEDFRAQEESGGYVNRGFSGSSGDPDSLDFDLRKPVNAEMTMDNLDCVDSGINSVETIEFQPSQEPSLEQSLMEIIDAKLGRAPAKRSWEDLSDKNEPKETAICEDSERVESVESPLSTLKDTETLCNSKMEQDLTEEEEKEAKDEVREIVEAETKTAKAANPGESSTDLEDIENQPNFDKLRLELIGNNAGDNKRSAITALREKFVRRFGKNREEKSEDSPKSPEVEEAPPSPVELRVKREMVWHHLEPAEGASLDESPMDFVKFRKCRKPTIVFLHGFGSSAEIFEHQLEYFSNLGYPCIAPEMLGHGMSSAPDRSRDYHFDKLLKDLEMVLQHYAFGSGRKCVLVAHNYGCSFATALACKYDSDIHQLVLISGGGPTPLAPPSSEGAGHCCLRAMLTPLLMCGLHRDILYSARGRQHPYCGPEPPEQWPSHMKYVLDGMVWPEGDYVFHRRICTPTLLIHGLRDNKVSLVQECQMERTIIKAFLDAIPTAGHTPMTDCPEQVNHMIHCFIDLWRRKKR